MFRRIVLILSLVLISFFTTHVLASNQGPAAANVKANRIAPTDLTQTQRFPRWIWVQVDTNTPSQYTFKLKLVKRDL